MRKIEPMILALAKISLKPRRAQPKLCLIKNPPSLEMLDRSATC